MKFTMLFMLIFSATSLFAAKNQMVDTAKENIELAKAKAETMQARQETENMKAQLAEQAAINAEILLKKNEAIHISVSGQGVAPMNTTSPAQAYALAKRAAIADAYRAIAEKVKGVRIDGQDLIKNMMVKRTTIRTSVKAMIRNANIVETTFKEGLCEVEMEIIISHSDFAQ